MTGKGGNSTQRTKVKLPALFSLSGLEIKPAIPASQNMINTTMPVVIKREGKKPNSPYSHRIMKNFLNN